MPLVSRDPASRAIEAPSESRVEVVPVGTSRVSRDEGFAAFMASHQGDLLRTAWLLCGDAHRAEELTQQALVRTYAAWPRASGGDPLAYARRVLVNLRVDTWRRRRREVLTPPERMPDSGVPADGRADDRDQLVRALATLTTRQRRVIVLRHLLDLPESEVAAELGITVGTVKSTASRALAALRASMADDGRPSPSSPRRSS
ncbi:SigE family RNA polymerase sigma factor [Pengzhenrongella phosphoraccumulans]|uniref:SigE family RNA polymerase sigma factor n=1 Tax=Pengzhenrongella phosphoraccumulans TaxID=3114394 RepID=UPI0038902FD7